MRFHGLDADVELLGDFLGGVPFGDELKNLALPQGEFFRAGGRYALDVAADEVLGDFRAEISLATGHGANGLFQLGRVAVFEQVARRPDAHRLEDIFLGGVHGQDDDADLGEFLDDPGGRFQSIEPGHHDVHQDDVRPVDFNLAQRRPAVAGFAHDFNSGKALHQGAESGSHEIMVVRE